MMEGERRLGWCLAEHLQGQLRQGPGHFLTLRLKANWHPLRALPGRASSARIASAQTAALPVRLAELILQLQQMRSIQGHSLLHSSEQ